MGKYIYLLISMKQRKGGTFNVQLDCVPLIFELKIGLKHFKGYSPLLTY